MTTTRSHLEAAFAAAALLIAAATAPAMAQGSDRMPGGVERQDSREMMGTSRGLAPPPPAPAPAAAPAAPVTTPKPDAGKSFDTEPKPKGKKSSKGSGHMYEAPARERSITAPPSGSGDDKRVGGVERSPGERGSQP